MKKLMLAIAAVTLLTVPAVAEVLWNQYAPDLTQAYNDFDAGCVSATTVFQANDVTFLANTRITSITTVYNYFGGTDQDLINVTTQAHLMITPKDGTMQWPADDPRDSSNPNVYGPVNVTVTVVNINGIPCQELTASGLDITLYPGSYWVSFNPIAVNVTGGLTNKHYVAAAQYMDDLLYTDVCSGLVWTPMGDLLAFIDSTLKIEGEAGPQVVATEDSSWGQLKALYR